MDKPILLYKQLKNRLKDIVKNQKEFLATKEDLRKLEIKFINEISKSKDYIICWSVGLWLSVIIVLVINLLIK